MRTKREAVLADGIKLTTGDRNRTYGEPAKNLTLQMKLFETYQAATAGREVMHSLAHDAAMQHVFAKIARIATGKGIHRDNYVDGATYLAIAFECAGDG